MGWDNQFFVSEVEDISESRRCQKNCKTMASFRTKRLHGEKARGRQGNYLVRTRFISIWRQELSESLEVVPDSLSWRSEICLSFNGIWEHRRLHIKWTQGFVFRL